MSQLERTHMAHLVQLIDSQYRTVCVHSQAALLKKKKRGFQSVVPLASVQSAWNSLFQSQEENVNSSAWPQPLGLFRWIPGMNSYHMLQLQAVYSETKFPRPGWDYTSVLPIKKARPSFGWFIWREELRTEQRSGDLAKWVPWGSSGGSQVVLSWLQNR